MKTLKVMSIIGIMWFMLCFSNIVVLMHIDLKASVGWGVLAVLYGVIFSIVALIKSIKVNKKD